MTFDAIITNWTKFIDKTSTLKYGNEIISESIRFMIDVFTSRNARATGEIPGGVCKDERDVGRCQTFMKLLIALLLDGCANMIKSPVFIKLNTCSDGTVVDKLMQRVAKKCPQKTIGLQRMRTVNEFAQRCISRLGPLLANDNILSQIFAATSGQRQANDSPIFYAMVLKIRIFEYLRSETDICRMMNIDRYLISLAALGKRAAEVYGEYNDTSLAKNVCVNQSIAHPDFDFEKFLSDGPISLFYGHNKMMEEINFVISNNNPYEQPGSRFMMTLYGNNPSMISRASYRYHSFHSKNMLVFLLNVLGIRKHRSIDETYNHIKSAIGEERLRNPILAFTRSF